MTESCKVPLILHGELLAEYERESGHRGRHKGKSEKPIYTELEWTLKKEKKE